MIAHGWYPDPVNPQIDRFWNGVQWTGDTRMKQVGFAAAGPDNRSTVTRALNRPSSNRWIRLGIALAGLAVTIVIFRAFGAVRHEQLLTNIGAHSIATSNYPSTPIDIAEASVGPRETIDFGDGLTATITAIAEGKSTSKLDGSDTFTVVSIELLNTGSTPLDASDWFMPSVSYGAGKVPARSPIILGTINGIRPGSFPRPGLIQPGGVVTVNSAYVVSLSQLTQATMVPVWDPLRQWSGDFMHAFAK